MIERLFDIRLPERQWLEFSADGFSRSVAGVIFRAGQSSCGIPLGGIGTGCFDLNTDGILGRCSIFNTFVPHRVLDVPFAAISTGSRAWGLTTRKLAGVGSARQIDYWGHYPIADMEFEIDCPISVGLRTWCPFLPGDAITSNTPAAFFEFRLRNHSKSSVKGKLAFTFIGPTDAESGACKYHHDRLSDLANGVTVTTDQGIGYALAVLGDRELRFGGALVADSANWTSIITELPQVDSSKAGCSVAVDYELRPDEDQIISFVLAWYYPRWAGSEAHHYWHAYKKRFNHAGQVTNFIAGNHVGILSKIIAWQSEIYGAENLPAWLRDQLINVLHTIPEDSFWAGESIPAGDWYGRDGIFGLTESPRTTPHICNPSDWYGGLPVVYFFPELAASLLRAYAHFQLTSGEIPLAIGEGADLERPCYHILHTMNSLIHVQLVDRLWQRDLSEAVLREFYGSVKNAVSYTKGLDRDGDGLPDLEPDPIPNHYYPGWKWYGTSIHVDGLWLAALAMAERMARQLGDSGFSQDSRLWLEAGKRSLEEKLWGGNWYLLYHDPAAGRKSDTLLANQLAGQMCTYLHGLPPVVPRERVEKVLASVKRLCIESTKYGVVDAVLADGTPDTGGTPYSENIFTGECVSVAMTYAYAGDRKTAEEVVSRLMDDIVLRQGVGWDLPNTIDAVTGAVVHGTDFYQMMVLWGLPLALCGQNIQEACTPGNLVSRILKAANLPLRAKITRLSV